MTTRIEKDPLGEKAVPSDALYGVQTLRAAENFPISGLRPLPAFVDAVVWIKRSAALTHKETGRLEAKLADAIVQAADEVLSGKHRDQFIVDVYQAGAGTSHNMNCNEVLANRANEILGQPRGSYSPVHPNDHVNMAQSTNDVIPTAMRLATLATLSGLLGSLDALGDALLEKGHQFDGVIKSGRTHLQDATPIRLGQEFAAYGRTVLRHREKLAQAADWLRSLGIGGTAVGTGLNAEPEYITKVIENLSEQTGFRLRTAEDLVQSTQSMAPMMALSAALRGLAVDLAKILEDFLLMSSGPRTGFAEIKLPARQPGSSIMPGKVNPVMVENLAMISYHVIGADTAVAWAASRGQLELNVMMPLIAHEALESLSILTTGCRQFAKECVAGIEADQERAAWLLENSSAMATPLAPYIGYALAAAIAKEAVASGKTIRQLVIEKGVFTEDELNQILDPHELTKPGVAGDFKFEPRMPKGYERPTGPVGGGG